VARRTLALVNGRLTVHLAPHAIVSLHALGRWFERTGLRDHDALVRDLTRALRRRGRARGDAARRALARRNVDDAGDGQADGAGAERSNVGCGLMEAMKAAGTARAIAEARD